MADDCQLVHRLNISVICGVALLVERVKREEFLFHRETTQQST